MTNRIESVDILRGITISFYLLLGFYLYKRKIFIKVYLGSIE